MSKRLREETADGKGLSKAATYKRQSRARLDEEGPQREKEGNKVAARAYRQRKQLAKQAQGAKAGPSSSALPESNALPQPPPPPPPPESPPPPPRVPPPTHPDFVKGVLGVQVSQGSKTIEWKDGPKTVLPYLPESSKGKLVNALQIDRAYVSDLASLPETMLSNGSVAYLPKSTERRILVGIIQEHLAKGRTVVLKNYGSVDGFEFSLKGLLEEFSCFPDRIIQAHDMRKRAKDPTNPHIKVTVKEFMEGVIDTTKVQVALDFPLSQMGLPGPLHKLDDGISVGFNQTHHVVDVDGTDLPPDTLLVGSWGLLHHAAIVTYPHHDAEGACTWVMPYNGCKVWTCIQVKTLFNRKKLASFLAKLANRENALSSFEDDVKCETVYLYPGDLVIMPPGQMHAVYTPTACFCRGGHFFSYDTLHLTEQSRHIDRLKGRYVTNQEHRGTLETLARMVIALPIISESKKLYKRSLVALCGMVVYDGEYRAQQTKRQTSECHAQARAVATKVLGHFGIGTLSDYFKFVEDPEVDPAFKGEQVSLYDLLEEFRTIA